jgi:TldD protein
VRDRLKAGVDELKRLGVDYGDLRYGQRRTEHLTVRNGSPDGVSRSDSQGVGVRVIHGGAWGFAATADTSEKDVIAACRRAVAVAKSSARVLRKKVTLSPVEPEVGAYAGPCSEDPFDVPLDEKLAILTAAEAPLRENPAVKVAQASIDITRNTTIFASTEGAYLEQSKTESGAGMEATAVEGPVAVTRSYPNSHFGDHALAGFEFVRSLDLPAQSERVREEVLELLAAPECPSSENTLIVGGAQMTLQVHESCGHPVELDRVLGTEISLAGGSFMTADKLGSLRYGTPIVNIVADATIPDALGSFGWDDEGVPAQRSDIIRKGMFVGYLTSRETAPIVGLSVNGTMRADGYDRIPLIRMTNINLEPDPDGPSLEDLIADTKSGIFVDVNRSWSIDDHRVNFQFGCEWARKIENGALGQVYRNSLYTAQTTDFWNSCDSVCGPDEWHVWGLPSCGKGEPMQSAHVAHGTVPARFRNVQVGAK